MLHTLLQATQPVVQVVAPSAGWTPDAVVRVLMELGAVITAVIAAWKASSAQKTANDNTDRANLHSTQIAAALLAAKPNAPEAAGALDKLAAVAEATAAPSPPAKVPVDPIPSPAGLVGENVTWVTPEEMRRPTDVPKATNP